MPERFTYILVDAGCFLVPFLFSFHPRIRFIREARFFLLPCLLTALIFLAWDVLFTDLGVWSFNPKRVLGFYVFNLPVEEVLFFICIPYACVFTYFCLKLFFRFAETNRRYIFISAALILFLLLTGFLHLHQLYTSVTFIALALFLSLLLLLRYRFLPAFLISFVAILPMFFLSNGILTGSFISEPVVLYNNAENLGIRMFTIPFEDTFYGMLLLLLNVSGYEFLRLRFALRKV